MSNSHESLYAPTMIIAFISTVFGAMNFCSTCLSLDPQTIFSIGIIRAILGLIFFISSLIQIFKGEIYGNINLVFSIIFGFFSGTNAILTESETFRYELIQSEVFAVIQILAGCYLGLILPVMRKLPAYQWGAYCCIAIAIICFGLGTLLDFSPLNFIGGLLNIPFALFSMYIGLRAIEDKLPRGYLAHHLLYEHGNESHKKHKHSFQNILMEQGEHEEYDEP